MLPSFGICSWQWWIWVSLFGFKTVLSRNDFEATEHRMHKLKDVCWPGTTQFYPYLSGLLNTNRQRVSHCYFMKCCYCAQRIIRRLSRAFLYEYLLNIIQWHSVIAWSTITWCSKFNNNQVKTVWYSNSIETPLFLTHTCTVHMSCPLLTLCRKVCVLWCNFVMLFGFINYIIHIFFMKLITQLIPGLILGSICINSQCWPLPPNVHRYAPEYHIKRCAIDINFTLKLILNRIAHIPDVISNIIALVENIRNCWILICIRKMSLVW